MRMVLCGGSRWPALQQGPNKRYGWILWTWRYSAICSNWCYFDNATNIQPNFASKITVWAERAEFWNVNRGTESNFWFLKDEWPRYKNEKGRIIRRVVASPFLH